MTNSSTLPITLPLHHPLMTCTVGLNGETGFCIICGEHNNPFNVTLARAWKWHRGGVFNFDVDM